MYQKFIISVYSQISSARIPTNLGFNKTRVLLRYRRQGDGRLGPRSPCLGVLRGRDERTLSSRVDPGADSDADAGAGFHKDLLLASTGQLTLPYLQWARRYYGVFELMNLFMVDLLSPFFYFSPFMSLYNLI